MRRIGLDACCGRRSKTIRTPWRSTTPTAATPWSRPLSTRPGRFGGIVFIGHELTAETQALLRDGVMTLTIDQAFELQARRAVEVLLHQVGRVDTLPGPVEIPFSLHTRENA